MTHSPKLPPLTELPPSCSRPQGVHCRHWSPDTADPMGWRRCNKRGARGTCCGCGASRLPTAAPAANDGSETVLFEIAHRKAAVAYAKVATHSPDSTSWQRRARALRRAATALVEARVLAGLVECSRCGQDTTAARQPSGAAGPLCPSCAAAARPAPTKQHFIIICHDRRDDTRSPVRVGRKVLRFTNEKEAFAEAHRRQVEANKAVPGGLPAPEGVTGFPFDFYAKVAP